jgi:hypothetical protein
MGSIFSVPGLDDSATMSAKMTVIDLLNAVSSPRPGAGLESSFAKWILTLCGQQDTGTMPRMPRASTLPIQG